MLIDFLARDGGNQFKIFRGDRIRCIVATIVNIYSLGYLNLANGGDESNDLNSEDLLQVSLSDSARGHPTCDKNISVNTENCPEGIVPMVSRALLRPPPLLALMPYFWR
jgi:hypothetical protein